MYFFSSGENKQNDFGFIPKHPDSPKLILTCYQLHQSVHTNQSRLLEHHHCITFNTLFSSLPLSSSSPNTSPHNPNFETPGTPGAIPTLVSPMITKHYQNHNFGPFPMIIPITPTTFISVTHSHNNGHYHKQNHVHNLGNELSHNLSLSTSSTLF